MKKILILFMILIIALANCFGCVPAGNDDGQQDDVQTEMGGGNEGVGEEENSGTNSGQPTIVPPIQNGGSLDFN